MGDRRLGPKGTSMIQVSPGNFVPVSNFAGSITATAPKGGIGGGTTLPASVNMGGMGGVGGSGGDAGGDAVTVADILNLPKVLTDEEKFQKAEEELLAAAERLQNHKASKEAEGAYGYDEGTEEGGQGAQYFVKQAELQAELEQARENYIALGGDPNPSFLSKVGQGALDLIGGTGQVLSDIATLGTGPEVAQTLLDPVSILLGGLGGTINYSQSGKTTPLILGQTSSGMPVGLSIPDPRSVLEGGLTTLIPGAAAAASTAGALSVSGNEQDQDPTTSGVGVTPAGVLTATAADDDKVDDAVDVLTDAAAGDDDTVKVQEVTVGDLGDAIGPVQEVTVGDLGPAIGPVQEVTGGGGEDDDEEIIETLLTGGGGEDDDEKIVETLLTGGDGDPEVEEEIIETLLTGGDGDPEVEEEIIETTTETPEPTKTTTTATTTGGDGGGGTLRLPPRLRGVREKPGDVVDIDYLYDFAKGLDQPFLTTNEDDEVKNLSVFAEGGPTDAVDMLTRPRRPGEYGRRYFEDAVFTPTGTALGGEALDPTKIQIPQYKFERDLLPQFKTPTQTMPSSAAVPMDAVSYTATPNEDIDVDTLLELIGLMGMEGLGFAAGGMAMGGPNYLAGATDGMADLIPATIGGTQPAALSDGEFVIPADVVSHLGNGNSDAGAKQLYAMMDRVRDERTGTTKQGPEIDPTKMMPA